MGLGRARSAGAGELAEMFPGGGKIGGMGRFGGVEKAEINGPVIDLDLRLKSLRSLVPADAFQGRVFPAARRRVATVLRMRCLTQIAPSIIIAHAVPMIDHSARPAP